MIGNVKNYDLICYQLRNSLYAQLDNPLKKDLDTLSKDITDILKSGKEIQGQTMRVLAQIFDLRVKAIKWLSKANNFNYFEMLTEVSEQIKEMGDNKKMEILRDNILFALRCNQRVIESLFHEINQHSVEQSENPRFDFNQLPDINYQQFLATLAYTIPDDEIAQKIADWTNASLHIEFVMLAADIIEDTKLNVSDKIINELSFLVADAAQEYAALATEFGILKSRMHHHSFSNQSFDKAFVNEQKALADIGIDDLHQM
jgi:hypothetical protein